VELSRRELCAVVAEICRQIKEESGSKAFHGGIYPENISRNPKGEIGIGPGKKSDWTGQELQYIAPEIYWHNRSVPQSDVYALGLILYCGASAGKLPFEGEAGNAQLMRMSGKTVYAPPAAGRTQTESTDTRQVSSREPPQLSGHSFRKGRCSAYVQRHHRHAVSDLFYPASVPLSAYIPSRFSNFWTDHAGTASLAGELAGLYPLIMAVKSA